MSAASFFDGFTLKHLRELTDFAATADGREIEKKLRDEASELIRKQRGLKFLLKTIVFQLRAIFAALKKQDSLEVMQLRHEKDWLVPNGNESIKAQGPPQPEWLTGVAKRFFYELKISGFTPQIESITKEKPTRLTSGRTYFAIVIRW
jgi:hypothetical protein